MYWNAFVVFVCFVSLIFSSFMRIVLEVWTSDSVRWDEEDVTTAGKEDGSSVDKGMEQDHFI